MLTPEINLIITNSILPVVMLAYSGAETIDKFLSKIQGNKVTNWFFNKLKKLPSFLMEDEELEKDLDESIVERELKKLIKHALENKEITEEDLSNFQKEQSGISASNIITSSQLHQSPVTAVNNGTQNFNFGLSNPLESGKKTRNSTNC